MKEAPVDTEIDCAICWAYEAIASLQNAQRNPIEEKMHIDEAATFLRRSLTFLEDDED